MNWRIIVTDNVKKKLKRFPRKDMGRIELVIDEMEINPFKGDITKLEGEINIWRRRVGNYRILYEFISIERIIYIYDIVRRTSGTY